MTRRPGRMWRQPPGPNTSPLFWPASLQEELARRVAAMESLGYTRSDAYERACQQLDPSPLKGVGR